jgi:hypothetical protein
MKLQSLMNSSWWHILGVFAVGIVIITSFVESAYAQTGSELPILNHVQGEVLVDVYDNPANNNLIADGIPLELYTKRVLPNEWFSTWHSQSLRSGAVAVRTYALYRVHQQIRLYDEGYGQDYEETCYVGGNAIPCENITSTRDAVNATQGRYMAMAYNPCVDDDAPIDARHQQETGNPTDDWTDQGWPYYPYLVGVEDEHTQQATQYPGMCQIGSNWYATERNWDYLTILGHYYSGFAHRLIGGYAGGCIEGDVEDCDCVVNIYDLTAISGRYNMTSQDPNWDPHYNIAHQPGDHTACKIDLFDLVMVSGHYNETCQF